MEISSGWFIQFSKDEKKDEDIIIQYLIDNDYPTNDDGIKQLLLDTIDDEPEEKPVNPILDAIKNNPEVVQGAIGGIGSLLGKALNKKIFKK